MKRAALLSCLLTACMSEVAIESDDAGLLNEPCTDAWCGRNTRDVGNGFLNEVSIADVAWKSAAGEVLEPRLSARFLYGKRDAKMLTGYKLNGSVMTVGSGIRRQQIRFKSARWITLPNGVGVWTYRLEKRRGFRPWSELCSLFDHDPNDQALYAFMGTSERVRGNAKRVQAVAPTAGILTIGCPNSATGKLLGLGALRTTATSTERPTAAEMTASLRAFTLSPEGTTSYTKPGVGVMINVQRTGVNNHGESLTQGIEGKWDARGAICFEALRISEEDERWSLYKDSGVPACSDVQVDAADVLVTSYLFLGIYDDYPPAPPPIGGFTL